MTSREKISSNTVYDASGAVRVVPSDTVDIWALLSSILRWRRLFALTTLIVIAALMIPAFTSPRSYVSVASLLPEGRGSSNVSGLAAQLGIAMPADGGGQSPAIYEDLVRSRAVLGRLADTVYVVPGTSRKASLADVLEIPEGAAERRRNSAISYLRDAVSVSTNAKSGIVTVRATTTNAALSHEIAAGLLAELGRFNRERRRTNASNEGSFAANRLSEATNELRAAENSLQQFLERNRGDFRQSPMLSFEHDRLARQVALKSQTQLTLAEALERARVDAARETPQFTIIDAPETPLSPQARPFVLRAILGLVLGLALATVLSYLLDLGRTASLRGEEAFEEFRQLRREAISDLRNPVRLIVGRRATTHAAD